MARIEPFAGIRYTSHDVSALIAPPYDVLSDQDKHALLAKDDHNIVAIDLHHVPPKSAGPDQVYAQAGGELTRWLDIRTLRHESRPALYAYHQTYKLRDKTLVRKKFFARLRLEEFGSGGIFPHEQTFGGPKEDRLKLTLATRCNLSPILCLYPDASNEVMSMLDGAIQRDPDQYGMLDGVENKLWVVDDMATIKAVQVRLSDKPIFIADGHHRYSTALAYRERTLEEMGQRGPNDPVHYVLAVLVSMEDPGATIQPYFRTIVEPRGITANELQDALSGEFTWSPMQTPKTPDDLEATLAAAGPRSLGLYSGKDDAVAVVVPRDAELLAPLEPSRAPAWRRQAYAILHSFIIDRVIKPKFAGGSEPKLNYHKSMGEAVKDARTGNGIACLMPATTMAELRDICTAGELMPQKSTYFFPKLATGMVINPLY